MKVTLITTNNNIVEHGLRSISSYLKLNGIKTQLLFLGLGLDYKKDFDALLLKKIKAMVADSDIVGITTMSLSWPRAKTLIRYLRKNVKIPIVLGGIHATVKPDECIKEVDYVCIGEGEKAFLSLAKNIKKTNIQNMWIRKGKNIIKNEIGNLEENLDLFGIPDYDIQTHYIYVNGKITPFKEENLLKNTYYIHTSRGCPHSCTYCINNFLRKLYNKKNKYLRFRSIPNVIKELEIMKKKFPNAKEVFISDDTFFYRDLKDLKLFAREYKKKKFVPFSCYASPLTLTKEKLDILSDANLKTLQMGIQTGSDRLNKEVYKRWMPNNKILEAAELLHNYANKINIDYQFIITNQYETREDLLASLYLVKKMPKPFTLTSFNLTYFYGTEIYDKACADGLICSEADTAVQFHFYDIINHMKIKKLKERYLNSMMYWISGRVTNTRYGFVPAFLFPFLISYPIINLFEFLNFPIYFINWFKTKLAELLRPPI